jgi:phospholipid/cholesterol/gamma-HCH transport system ATP-binding protein
MSTDVTAAPQPPGSAATTVEPVVVLDHVALAFDDKVVLKDVSFSLLPGRTKIILGGSGSGKSTVLKLMLGFWKPDAGHIWVNGAPVDTMSEQDLMAVRGNVGIVFQEGALFDSLTVGENVGYRLYEETDQSLEEVEARVAEVLGFVGLGEFAERMPSELSGGQRRRVAIARAMASQPGILLYDEATTGLDPITAMSVNEEIIKLRDLHNVTTIIVTHQLRDAFFVATHAAERRAQEISIVEASPAKADEAEFIMIKDGTVAFEGSAAELRASRDEYIRTFLS